MLEAFFDRLRSSKRIARDETLAERAKRTFASWDDRPLIIIDESDGGLENLRIALDCGYDGTSHENLKGLANAYLVESRRR